MPEQVNYLLPNGKTRSIDVTAYPAFADKFSKTFPGQTIRPATKSDINTLAAHSADASAPTGLEAAGLGAMQGATFGFGDEAAAGVGALMDPSYSYADRRNDIRNLNAEAASTSPWAYHGAEIAGSIPATIAGGALLKGATTALKGATSAMPILNIANGLAPLAARGVPAVEALAPTVAQRLAAAAPAAAAWGGLQGLGLSNADTAGGLALDTTVGGVLGAATGVLGSGANMAVRGAGNAAIDAYVARAGAQALRDAAPAAAPAAASVLGPLERLMVNTATDGTAQVRPAAQAAARAVGAALGGSVGSPGGLPGAAIGGAAGSELATNMLAKRAAPVIARVNAARALEQQQAAEAATLARFHGPEIGPDAASIGPPSTVQPFIQPAPLNEAPAIDPDLLPSLELARAPRGGMPQAPPEDPGLANTLRSVSDEMGLAPATAPAAPRAPMPQAPPMPAAAPPLERAAPAAPSPDVVTEAASMTPSGGEVPKGPGIDRTTTARRLQAERRGGVERRAGPETPETAADTETTAGPPGPPPQQQAQDPYAAWMQQAHAMMTAERERQDALMRQGLAAQIRQVMGITEPVAGVPATVPAEAAQVPWNDTVQGRAMMYRGEMQPSYAGETRQPGESMDQAVGRLLAAGKTDAQIARRLDTTLPWVRKAIRRVNFTKPLTPGPLPTPEPGQWTTPTPEPPPGSPLATEPDPLAALKPEPVAPNKPRTLPNGLPMLQPETIARGAKAHDVVRLAGEGKTPVQIAQDLDMSVIDVNQAIRNAQPPAPPPVVTSTGKQPKYLFHTTSAANLEGIASEGLQPGNSQTFGGGYAANTGGRVMFADTPASARSWNGHIENMLPGMFDEEAAHVPMSIRAPKSAVGKTTVDALGTRDIGSSVSGGAAVDPGALEVFTTSGWKPIGDVQPGDLATPKTEADWLAPVKRR